MAGMNSWKCSSGIWRCRYTPKLCVAFLCTFLSQSDAVVLQENDLEAIANHRVVVDHLTNGGDEANDFLGGVITWSSLKERERERESMSCQSKVY